jgi:DNA polymerase III delta prime subunit
MELDLIGQEDNLRILNQILTDPPHLFISGGYGCGKTTIMNAFLKAYYKQYNIENISSEWILNLSSDQDRGIHCVRQSVAEFVRHAPKQLGIYRWIICDDADSLPIISQQALRRPMETHNHITRFIFCSRYSSDLINPLRSRCLHIELETMNPIKLLMHFKKKGEPKTVLNFTPESLSILITLTQTPTEIKRMTNILLAKYEGQTVTIPVETIHSLFGSQSLSLCAELLIQYLKKDYEKCLNIFFKIWSTGISYEDFLNEMNITLRQLGLTDARKSQAIHQLILRGWIYFAQGKTHSFDILRLLFKEV